MNIDDYRAMKAQEEAEKNAQGASPETVPSTQATEPQVAESTQTETNETPQTEVSTNPQVFEINGEQVTLEELQRGYMRQSDYTKKTQMVAQQTREAQEALAIFDSIKKNPELAQQLNVDVKDLQIRQLEQQNYDFLVQQEINELSSKYADFEVSEVLNFAVANQMNSLEHAYLLNKSYKTNGASIETPASNTQSTLDMDAIKAQVKAELLAEMNTSTIISSHGGGTPPAQNTVELSPQELKIARAMKMSPEEYAKWR